MRETSQWGRAGLRAPEELKVGCLEIEAASGDLIFLKHRALAECGRRSIDGKIKRLREGLDAHPPNGAPTAAEKEPPNQIAAWQPLRGASANGTKTLRGVMDYRR